ncbi:hypothetical protein DC008_33990 [Streptomyces nigra]|nr:hypothetical protein DC008_33990 [Streptomyces nigra]
MRVKGAGQGDRTCVRKASAVSDLDSQIPYWNSAAATKTSTPTGSSSPAGLSTSVASCCRRTSATARYARGSSHFDDHGVFETEDGGVSRHHSRSWFFSLLRDFTTVASRDITVKTMSGHKARGIRILGRRPVSGPHD